MLIKTDTGSFESLPSLHSCVKAGASEERKTMNDEPELLQVNLEMGLRN